MAAGCEYVHIGYARTWSMDLKMVETISKWLMLLRVFQMQQFFGAVFQVFNEALSDILTIIMKPKRDAAGCTINVLNLSCLCHLRALLMACLLFCPSTNSPNPFISFSCPT